jgi:hypothetical protein
MSDFLRLERRAAKDAAEEFLRACESGDVDAFWTAADRVAEAGDGWLSAFRKLISKGRPVSQEIQNAFQQFWIQSKDFPRRIGNDRVLCDAVRILLPPYHGPGLLLYRGTTAGERRRRTYGLSWSDDLISAEDFARRCSADDGIVLETLAPPDAILAAIRYSKPFDASEIEQVKHESPNAAIHEYHHEREYVIDRRHLGPVSVVRRVSQNISQ